MLALSISSIAAVARIETLTFVTVQLLHDSHYVIFTLNLIERY